MGDLVSGAADGSIVDTQAVYGLPAHVASEKGLLQGGELAGDVVLAVELVFTEHSQEDVLGEDVLQEHLAHVGLGNGRADAAVALLEELRHAIAVGFVVGLGVGHGQAKVLEHGGEVGLELLLGLPELFDLRQFIVKKGPDEPVQFAGARHIHPHRLFAVLVQHGDAGILKDDVVAGVAAVELGLDLGVQVVVAVLGLPIAAGHAERVA